MSKKFAKTRAFFAKMTKNLQFLHLNTCVNLGGIGTLVSGLMGNVALCRAGVTAPRA